MFFKGKSLGLEIHQQGYAWTLASGQAESPVIERFEISDAKNEVLRPSIKEPNIADPAQLSKSLSDGWNRLSTDIRRVSLSIPDLAGRVMIVEMDSPIRNKAEGVDQVKWKLKKSFPVDLSELHLDYYQLATTGDGGSTLLVALISRSVITEYEDVLLSAGLEPVTVDFASFNLYRLFASRLDTSDHLTFLICHRGLLTVMVFKDGVLDFHRSKNISLSLTDPVRLYREVNSSLLVYSDSRGGWKPQRLFYYAAPEDRALFRSVIFEATSEEPIPVDTEMLISSSKQRLDRQVLPELLASLGAASRGLR